jgi:hypothetical protein
MAISRYNFTFTKEMADRPIIHSLSTNYDLVPVIERAQLSDSAGWMRVALNGEQDEIQRAVADLMTLGVMVTPIHLAPITEVDNALP